METSIEKETGKTSDAVATDKTAQLELAPVHDNRAVWETRETYGPAGEFFLRTPSQR